MWPFPQIVGRSLRSPVEEQQVLTGGCGAGERVGQGDDVEAQPGARPGDLGGLSGAGTGETGSKEVWVQEGRRERWPRGLAPGSGRSKRGERRNSVSDMVSVGFPEGVRWGVGMGKGWDTLGGGLGVAGSQKRQECGGPSATLTICRGAPTPGHQLGMSSSATERQ